MVVIFFFLSRKHRKLSYLILFDLILFDYFSLFFLITDSLFVELSYFFSQNDRKMKQRYVGYLILTPILLLSYFIQYFTDFLVVAIVTIYFHNQENTNNFKKEK